VQLADFSFAVKQGTFPAGWFLFYRSTQRSRMREAHMREETSRRSLSKRILLVLGGLCAFILLFIVACRIAVQQIFMGIEQSRATGLASTAWDLRSMWSQGGYAVDLSRADLLPAQISRSAELRTITSSFDPSVAQLHASVSAHGGYLEDLRTESRSREGRMLSALLCLPSAEFDSALSDLKKIGRVEAISEGGEDAAVKVETAARHVVTAQTNLARLQKLQRERNGVLRDALALEKEIALANQAVADAQRQHEDLLSTVAQGRIRFNLVEEFRAPLEANLAGATLRLRNSFIGGVGAIFSSASVFVGVLFEYGLPLLFWIALLFLPSRFVWRRFQGRRLVTVGTQP
jgi:hypothetical protein